MKILFACHRFPFPPNRGGKIRPFNMIRHLSRQNSVTVASLAHTEQELREGEGLKQYCSTVLAEVLPSSARWTQAASALLSTTPSSAAYFRSSRLLRRVREQSRRTRFDVLIAHCAFAAQYVLGLESGFRILDLGDIDSGKWFDYARFRAFPLSVGYRIEARKLQNYERKLAKEFDRCTVTTAGEQEEFTSLEVPRPCLVIPNGVDTSYFHPLPLIPGSAVLAFLGRMDYFPNVDGVVYFTRTILPLIRPRVPHVELRIVGSSPAAAVRELTEVPGVHVTGYVPDVRPALEGVAVGVAPLRIARGTQNKVLEFMAMGIPVVATSKAAHGIQATPGRDLLVADEPEHFARHVIELIENESLRRGQSQAGRQQIELAHNWERSMGTLDDLLNDARAAEGAGALRIPVVQPQ